MKKIVIIGANYFQNRLILKAKTMGYETHVFAWKSGDIGERTADFFYPISITEKEEILERCREIKPEAIVSIASDLAVLTVNYVARNLGLVGNSEESDRITTNKYDMREALQKAGLPVPRYYKVKRLEANCLELDFSHPWIIKPTDRSGSRGICKITKSDELVRAVAEAQKQSFEKAAIIEEFIDGKEYSAECISYKGHHHLLAITEKFTTGAPHFIETGHIQPSLCETLQNKQLEAVIFSALDALHIKYGASHVEFKVTEEEEIRLIEIGARMGGDFIGSDLVQLSTGNDYVKMVIEVALGKKPELTVSNLHRPSAVRFVMCKEDLHLLDRIKDIQVIDKQITRNDFQNKVSDSSTRYGYFLVTADSTEILKKNLFE